MEWFKNWFNQDYLLVYAHRTGASAEVDIESLGSWLDLKGQRVLDLGCGSGRHLRPMAKRASFVCGVDLSQDLLSAAAETTAPNVSLVRADLRQLPFSPASFSLLTSFFTGFGYLSTDAEHRALLSEWFRLIEPGGFLLLDYINKSQVLAGLEPETRRKEGPIEIVERRAISPAGDRIEKEISVASPGEAPRVYRETVRLYSPSELQALIASAGFVSFRTFADFAGSEFAELSPRYIVLAERPR